MTFVAVASCVLAFFSAKAQTKISQTQTNFTELSIFGGSTAEYLTEGPAPESTTWKGTTYDAVVYLDSADGKLKIRKKDGTVVSLEP